jgi:6,7-dimethyl-8-ribityllumazine synthase
MASNLKNLSDYNKDNFHVNEDAVIGIVVSEWNDEITNALAEGAIATLLENGIKEENIIVKYVPGTYELALGAKYLFNYTFAEAVLCLGCVIQGETRHFDFICQASADAIARLNLETEMPVIFGVLTTDNQEQARDRSGGKHGNKGTEAAATALKMLSLEHELSGFDPEAKEAE